MRVPKYRKNGDGRAFVEYQCHRTYLGIYGTPESQQAYRQFIASIFTNPADVIQPRTATVAQICEQYLIFAETYYSAELPGTTPPVRVPTGEFVNVRNAVADFIRLFAGAPGVSIGPLMILRLQNELVEAGYSRGTINSRVSRVKRCLRWCASRELIPGSVAESIWTVPGLQKGRTKAVEPEPVTSVAAEVVAATIPFLSPIVAAMVQVQYLCGMRPQDVCAMRLVDIDRSGDVWIYRPESHKNAWRGKPLIKAIPPEAQALLVPYLTRPAESYLFSPRESIAWWNAQRPRTTPVYACELKKRKKKHQLAMKRRGGRPLPSRFSTASYGKSISSAITKANGAGVSIPLWKPNQLRHSIATKLRKLLGQQAAQAWLGHAKIDTTALYAEVHEQELRQISERLSASSET